MRLDYYLRGVVAAEPEQFVRSKQMWSEWHKSRYAQMFPVFKTSGDPFVVFTIYRDGSGELIVAALYFGRNGPAVDFHRRLRGEVIEPRVEGLASGAAVAERLL